MIRLGAAVLTLLLVAVLALISTPGASEATALDTASVHRPAGRTSGAELLSAPTPPLVLLAQTPWVTQGQTFDLHLRPTADGVAAANLGISVSVYPCLSSISGFDQSLVSTSGGTPMSSTHSPIALGELAALPQGGYDLPMPVVVGGSGSAPSAAGAPSNSFTIHLLPASQQCQSYPAGVYPVRVQLVDTSTSAVLGSFTTHLIFSESPPGTQHLRVAVVLPVQITQKASRSPSPAMLIARPSAALDTPPDLAISAVAATVNTITTQHPSVPVTLQVSGQTVELLGTASHQETLTQLGVLASTPAVHQLTAAPYTPVDAAALIASGLGSELGLQVSRGSSVVDAATERPAPTSTAGLGPWITGDNLDASTVGALAAGGFRQVVLPASAVNGVPVNGSTTVPFVLTGTRGSQVTAAASAEDLTARFTSNPGNPALAAHQLVAELAQLYYERPNGVTPRAVFAVAPNGWTDNPAFVDALLGSLDGNPLVQAVTTSQLFDLFATPASCRTTCRLLSPSGSTGLPAAAIRAQRARVNGFAGATGSHSLPDQLGDLVLSSEAQGLRPQQQQAVIANARAALDAQLGLLAVEGDQTVTLTARSGLIPVTVVSNASYPITGSLDLSSDKLLFPNGETQWTTPLTLLPRHSNVIYVRVRTRISGVFRLNITVRSPDGSLRLTTGELSVRSTASSVVGAVLTAGALAVLIAWWVRTSLKRRKSRGDDFDPPTEDVGLTP